MPYKINTISKPKDHEPLGRSLGEALREVKNMTPGSELLSVVGGKMQTPTPMTVDALSVDEAEEKAAIAKLILAVVEPPLLSRHNPNPLANKISFTDKVKAMSLPELRRFVPSGIDARTIDPNLASEDFKIEMTRKYKDFSP